ncbi:MAG: transglutaminase-like domain-containing protein [Verrucomicrobiota bacterium]
MQPNPNPDSLPSKEALISLVDDESISVRGELRRLFRSHLNEAESFLREYGGSDNQSHQRVAQQWMSELGIEDHVLRFRALIDSFQFELETGLIMLCRTVNPKISTTEICEFLDLLAKRYYELAVHPASDLERCRLLNRVLFHEYGFRGDVENFYDPQNSLINRVLDRRKGIPLTLSVIYLLVAQRVGLELEPVGAPGRFLVGCFTGDDIFFIDPFERGLMRTRDDLLINLLKPQGITDERVLNPCPVGEVLFRCCRNLAHQYQLSGDFEKQALFDSFIKNFNEAYERETLE